MKPWIGIGVGLVAVGVLAADAPRARTLDVARPAATLKGDSSPFASPQPRTYTILHFGDSHLATRGPSQSLGIRLQEALERPGVRISYHPYGINGATARHLLEALENENKVRGRVRYKISKVRHLRPDLILVAFGTNEAEDARFNSRQFEANLRGLIGKLPQVFPGSRIALMTPPDGKCINLGRVVATQKAVAKATNTLLIDRLTLMGGYGSINSRTPWQSADNIHLRENGYDYLNVLTALALSRHISPRHGVYYARFNRSE